MKTNLFKKFLFIAMGIFLVLGFSSVSFAEYKIVLKNGSQFIVDSYQKVGDEVRIFLEGGTMSIKQKDIRSIKTTRQPVPKEVPITTTPVQPAPQPEKKEAAPPAVNEKEQKPKGTEDGKEKSSGRR